jgi:integrase
VISVVDPATGRRRRRWIGKSRTRGEAERVLTAALKDLDEGILTFPAKITVRGYLLGDGSSTNPGWVASMRSRVRDTTWASYQANLTLHVVPVVGGLKLQALTPVHLNSLYGELMRGNLSPRTVRYIHAIMHKALAEAVDAGILHSNPATRAKPPRPERPSIAVLNPEEMARLLRAAHGTPWEGPLTVSVGTGLRRGELLGLHWADVDLERGRLRVVSSLVRGPDGPLLAPPKTPRGRRPVALPPFVVTVLKAYKGRQTERRLASGPDWQDQDLVFDRGDGGPFDPDSFTHAFRKLSRTAGIPQARLHDLRHAFATMLLGKGVHPAIASAILGHASPGFTMRTYQHVVEGMESQAAAAIEELFVEVGEA